METVKCETCAKEFQDFPSNHRRFCSRPCYWKYLRTQKPWNKGKHYHHSREAREKKRSLMKKLVQEGKREPPRRNPYMLVDQQAGILLHRLYIEERMSARAIAKRLGVSDSLVLRRLKMFNIAVRPSKRMKKVQTDFLDWHIPCFCCRQQAVCGSHLNSPTPEVCEKLTQWLLGLVKQ